MTSCRVTSELWVSALRKRLTSNAIPFFLIKKGDKQAGAILIRVCYINGKSKIFEQVPSIDGERQWLETKYGPDDEVEKVLKKHREFDNDVWILEIEEFKGINIFEKFLQPT